MPNPEPDLPTLIAHPILLDLHMLLDGLRLRSSIYLVYDLDFPKGRIYSDSTLYIQILA